MNLPMACIVLLFAENPSEKIKLKEIQEVVGFDPTAELKALMNPKAANTGKQLLIRCHQADKKVRGLNDDDEFTFNPAYKPVSRGILDFCEYKAVLDEKESKKMISDIDSTRKFFIWSKLISIMKKNEAGAKSGTQIVNIARAQLAEQFPVNVSDVQIGFEELVTGTQQKTAGGELSVSLRGSALSAQGQVLLQWASDTNKIHTKPTTYVFPEGVAIDLPIPAFDLETSFQASTASDWYLTPTGNTSPADPAGPEALDVTVGSGAGQQRLCVHGVTCARCPKGCKPTSEGIFIESVDKKPYFECDGTTKYIYTAESSS